ncbi:UNVERIFIED_CONTAM: hypothetical protein FKN15_036576 [Acipenser sinensis]
MQQGDTRAEAAAGELKADNKNTVEQKGENTLLFVYKARLTKVAGLHSWRGLLYSGMKQQSLVEEYTAGWLSNNPSAAFHSTTLNRSDKRRDVQQQPTTDPLQLPDDSKGIDSGDAARPSPVEELYSPKKEKDAQSRGDCTGSRSHMTDSKKQSSLQSK